MVRLGLPKPRAGPLAYRQTGPATASVAQRASTRRVKSHYGAPLPNFDIGRDNASVLPPHEAAVRLRRYDERAEVKGLATPPVTHFMPAVARCLMP